MATENETRFAKLAAMPTRQKITIIALVVVVIVIVYQVIPLLSSPEAPKIQPVVKTAAPSPATKPAQPSASPVTQQPVVLNEGQIPQSTTLIERQKKVEEKYVESLNQLQALRVEKEIAEANQSIAVARLATITAEKNASDLLTRPMPRPVPAQPAAAYASSLVTPVRSGAPVATETVAEQPPAEVSYTVVSVFMGSGKWTAVLGYQNKLYNVMVGDVLPVDGSVVADINKGGIVLMKDGVRKKVSITSSI